MFPQRLSGLVRGRRRWLAGGAAAVAVACAVASIPAFAATAGPVSKGTALKPPADAVATDGARVVSEIQVDSRTIDLKIKSPALGHQGGVRVLLPPDYTSQPNRTWPVVWMLDGCCDDYDFQSWTHYTDLAQFTADQDALFVLPTDGQAGMFTNWWNFNLGGTHQWANFHLKEVKPIIERMFRGDPAHEGLAGISLGGYGAMIYPAQNPGMFKAAASFSGPLDIQYPGYFIGQYGVMIRVGANPLALWGDPVLNRNNWTQHNPTALVRNLKGVSLFVSCGNGQAGPLDTPGMPNIAGEVIESAVLGPSESFANAARAAGDSIMTDFYGPGVHYWPYWEREFHRAYPMFVSALGITTSTTPVATPSTGASTGASTAPTTAPTTMPSDGVPVSDPAVQPSREPTAGPSA